MARKRYSPEEIIEVLREVEIHTSQGKTVAEAVKQQGIAEQTYYRWRREYGGMDKSEVRRLKELERENARLKKLVAELALDKAILEEAVAKK
jgi:transposase-like protein